MYDLLIENARIVDGTGAPAYPGSLAVKDGRIVALGAVHSREAREDHRRRRPGAGARFRGPAHALRRADCLGLAAHARRPNTA